MPKAERLMPLQRWEPNSESESGRAPSDRTLSSNCSSAAWAVHIHSHFCRWLSSVSELCSGHACAHTLSASTTARALSHTDALSTTLSLSFWMLTLTTAFCRLLLHIDCGAPTASLLTLGQCWSQLQTSENHWRVQTYAQLCGVDIQCKTAITKTTKTKTTDKDVNDGACANKYHSTTPKRDRNAMQTNLS